MQLETTRLSHNPFLLSPGDTRHLRIVPRASCLYRKNRFNRKPQANGDPCLGLHGRGGLINSLSLAEPVRHLGAPHSKTALTALMRSSDAADHFSRATRGNHMPPTILHHYGSPCAFFINTSCDLVLAVHLTLEMKCETP